VAAHSLNAYVMRLTGDPQAPGYVLIDVVRVEFQAGVVLLYHRPDRNHPKYLELLAMIPLQGVSIAFGTAPPPGFPFITPNKATTPLPEGGSSPEVPVG